MLLPKVAKQYPIVGIKQIMTADGRRRYRVISPWKGPCYESQRNPHPPPTASMVRVNIKHFEEQGSINHSPMGMFVPYIVAYCHWKGVSYSLKAGFLDGSIAWYYIQKLDTRGNAVESS